MNISSTDSDFRNALRRDLRQQRRSLGSLEQALASGRLHRRLVHDPIFLHARRVAFYFACDGEIDPMPLLISALKMNKACYLPLLCRRRSGQVCFARFRYGDALLPNRWGIPEPVATVAHWVDPRSLDLVLVPLVGFDEQGSRLGMGKGFYDRSFGFRRRTGGSRPRLVGLAHEFQKVKDIPTNDWDIPLDAVITDVKRYRFFNKTE